ncbi:hypothetical protein [Streptomyces sp. AK02-04a]|nr:hypothetical protein [Streptomyces sp. AK02-04a]MDX3763844.1 hypothetical protein [Streptomyces sp. AK02-04a]
MSAALAELGLQVLLMEMDEQGNNGEDLGFTGTEPAGQACPE